jgi:hypothetical protein
MENDADFYQLEDRSSNRSIATNSERRGRGTKMKIGYIIASNKVAKERKPVGYLYREQPDNENDSGWRVFAGEESEEYAEDAANFAMYNASTILEIDPTIGPLLGLPPPIAFERTDSGAFAEVPPDATSA